jgi:hypothetical protein
MLQPTSYIIAAIDGRFRVQHNRRDGHFIDHAPAFAFPNAFSSLNFQTPAQM